MLVLGWVIRYKFNKVRYDFAVNRFTSRCQPITIVSVVWSGSAEPLAALNAFNADTLHVGMMQLRETVKMLSFVPFVGMVSWVVFALISMFG